MQLVQALKKNSGIIELKAKANFISSVIQDAIDNVDFNIDDVDFVTNFRFGTLEIRAKGYKTGHFSIHCKTNSRIYYNTVFSPSKEKIDACWLIMKVGTWVTQVCEKDTPYRIVFDAINSESAYTQDFDLDKTMIDLYKGRYLEIV